MYQVSAESLVYRFSSAALPSSHFHETVPQVGRSLSSSLASVSVEPVGCLHESLACRFLTCVVCDLLCPLAPNLQDTATQLRMGDIPHRNDYTVTRRMSDIASSGSGQPSLSLSTPELVQPDVEKGGQEEGEGRGDESKQEDGEGRGDDLDQGDSTQVRPIGVSGEAWIGHTQGCGMEGSVEESDGSLG